MVLPQTGRWVRASLVRRSHRLRLLGYGERVDLVVFTRQAIRSRGLCNLRACRAAHLEAQSFNLPTSLVRVGPFFPLLMLWNSQPTNI